VLVGIADGISVGFAVGVFVEVIVGRFKGEGISLKAGVSKESIALVGIEEMVFVDLGDGAPKIRGDGEGVGKDRAVSIGTAVAVKDGTGITGKP